MSESAQGVPLVIVLDASVGVKWFKPEAGRDAAFVLLERAIRGEATLVAPTHFFSEVLAVVRRCYSPEDVSPAWERLSALGISAMPLGDELVAEAARQCAALGCSWYDALAPACASLLHATLASADARAHAAYPGVLLIEAGE